HLRAGDRHTRQPSVDPIWLEVHLLRYRIQQGTGYRGQKRGSAEFPAFGNSAASLKGRIAKFESQNGSSLLLAWHLSLTTCHRFASFCVVKVTCTIVFWLKIFQGSAPLFPACWVWEFSMDYNPRLLGREGGERSEPGEGVAEMIARSYAGRDTRKSL